MLMSMSKPFALAIALLAAAASAVVAADRPPNIVLIMADDIGYECFGCYGSQQYQTPHIDRMAREGIRFTHAYSQPLCTPSRVKLMTGLSNVRNYVAFSVLDPGQRTFGHLLQDAGYRTAVIGKWQLLGAEQYAKQFRGKGVWPQQAGFDQHCLWQVDRLGERYWSPLLTVDGQLKQFPKDDYGPKVVTDYGIEFMEQNRDRPFFLYYPMILVHNPFEPTPDSANKERQGRQAQQRNFADMVAYMDKLVGRLVEKTEQLGIAEQTLFLFVGDNGTNSKITSVLDGRSIQGGKGQMTDAGTRVSLIGYWPGTIPRDQITDTLVDFSDFLPTLMEAAGKSAPQGLDGHSFLPQLKGQTTSGREWIYMYYCPRPERSKPVRFVRDQRWKLYGDGRFFDVQNDPLEKKPLKEAPSDAAAAKQKLAKALEKMPAEGEMLLQLSDEPTPES